MGAGLHCSCFNGIWKWFSLMPSEDCGCGQLWRHVVLKEERETGEESGQDNVYRRERLARMGERKMVIQANSVRQAKVF